MRILYLLLAIVGAIVPYLFFVDFFAAEGVDLQAFLASAFANGAAGGGMMDLVISSCVFWIFMFRNRPRGPAPWLFMVLNLTIGLSCALPAYLFAASRPAAGTEHGR